MAYRCGECGRPVKGVAGDAIHDLSARGRICSECVRGAPPATSKAAKDAAKVDSRLTSEERSKRGRDRWNALTPEQQAARVAKLRAGRTRAQADSAAEGG